ncbi:hypothetical protein HJFPF1_07281 [Paramyrothecium foliicola]|nr:hypothetical protein HJFPF1_07281 [Paramyrothecium foliicola]
MAVKSAGMASRAMTTSQVSAEYFWNGCEPTAQGEATFTAQPTRCFAPGADYAARANMAMVLDVV